MGMSGSYEKDKPNWRKAFEQVLAGGGRWSYGGCCFCATAGHKEEGGYNCVVCPLKPSDRVCEHVFNNPMDNSERRAICRHVLATVKDFTDDAEIRARAAEMLDDNAREKFLGKAEPELIGYKVRVLFDGPYTRPPKVGKVSPDLQYAIEAGGDGRFYIENIIAAFRDKDTRDLVLRFLNGETDA